MGQVGINQIPGIWADLEPLLERACSFTEGRMRPVDVVSEIAAGRFELWAVADQTPTLRSIAVTCFSDYPNGLRVLEVLLLAGEERERWLDPLEQLLERAARDKGATRLQMVGRKGWVRVLRKWRVVATMMERRLEAPSDG